MTLIYECDVLGKKKIETETDTEAEESEGKIFDWPVSLRGLLTARGAACHRVAGREQKEGGGGVFESANIGKVVKRVYAKISS